MAKARRPRSKGKPPARLDVYEAEEEVPAEEKYAGQRYDVRLSFQIYPYCTSIAPCIDVTVDRVKALRGVHRCNPTPCLHLSA